MDRLAAIVEALGEPYYTDGKRYVYCGDSLALLPRLPAGAFDIVLTDPPYSSGGMYRSDRSKGTESKYQIGHETTRTYAAFSGDNRDQRAFEKWCAWWMSDCLKATREGGVLGCFIDWRNIACVVDSVQVAGWVYRGIVPWYKGSDQRPMKGWFRRNVEYVVFGSNGALDIGARSSEACADGVVCHRVNGIEKQHQTQKPVEVFSDLLAVRSDWQLVLDPFAGSGTTAVAAANSGRECVVFEVEEAYCEIAANRLRQGVLEFA